MDEQILAQTLLTQRLLPEADIEQALQRCVINGGSLDTNLLEAGTLSEADVLQAFGAVFNLPIATQKAIDAIETHLVQTFPVVFAETYHLVPFRLESGILQVLVQKPLDPTVVERVAKRLQIQLVGVFTCEVRLHYAMHKLYGTELLPRYRALLAQLDGPSVQETPSAVALQNFEQHQLNWGVSPSRVSPARQAGGQRSDRHDVRSQVARLDAATDRDGLVDVLLGFAVALFDFGGLFLVQNQHVRGWRSLDARRTHRLMQLDLALAEPSIFHTLMQTGGPYLGPIPHLQAHQSLLTALDRPPPHAALLAPIVVGGKIAAILYCDNGLRPMAPKKVAALLVLVGRCGLRFEALIRQRKRQMQEKLEHPDPQNLVTPKSMAPPEKGLSNVDRVLHELEAEDAAAKNASVASPILPAASASDWMSTTGLQALAQTVDESFEKSQHEAMPVRAPTFASDFLPEQERLEDDADELPAVTIPSLDAKMPASDAVAISWDDVIDEAQRAQNLTPQKFATVQVHQKAVEQRDLLFDGLESTDLNVRQSAIAGLLALGRSIDQELMRRFPGTLAMDPLHTLPRDMPPFVRLNGLTELFVARGPDAAKLVLPHLESNVVLGRWAAVYYLSSVHYPQACEALARRLYDTEPRIATLAVEALTHYRAEAGYRRIVQGLREQLRVPVVETQVVAIQILGQLREPSAVPALIPLVVASSSLVARSAASALAVVCGQAFGADLQAWQSWWQANYTKPRTQWLMGGLAHSNATIRRVAHGELQRLTGHVVAFKPETFQNDDAGLLKAWQTALVPTQSR